MNLPAKVRLIGGLGGTFLAGIAGDLEIAMYISKDALTPWFDGAVKPVRTGVYQQRCGGGDEIGFQYWNGKSWGPWAETPEAAMNEGRFRLAAPSYQFDNWRGLVAKAQRCQ
jgi:hypothetical protein